MSKRLYTCVKCGGSVVPGQNGLLRGLSTEPDGYPQRRDQGFHAGDPLREGLRRSR